MRVIGGKFKARILKMPKGVKMRPSSQKVKEALFNILGRDIEDASFLELFAGSGNIGIEALSRGAKEAFFVENNRSCIKAIEANLKQLKIAYTYNPGLKKGAQAVILPVDAQEALKMLSRRGQKFDFVFLDPPYYQDILKNILIKIRHYDILKPRCYLIAEHNKRQILPQVLAGLRLLFTKRYGDAVLSFYEARSKL